MSDSLILLILVLAIALVSVLGGLIALLKQQVIVDQNGNPTKIELPWFGKIQTNYPSLVAVALGIALAAFVGMKLDVTVQVKGIPLVATIDTKGVPPGSYVTVVAVPQRYLGGTNQTDGDGRATVQFKVDDPDVPYSIVASTPIGFDGAHIVAYGQAKPDETGKQLVFSGQMAQVGQ